MSNKYIEIKDDTLGEYESERELNKNGLLSGTVVLLRTSIGSSLLVNQYYFIKLVFFPAFIVIVLAVILVNTFLIYLAKITDKVEEDKGIKIETFNRLCKEILGERFGWVIKVIMICYNLSCLLIGGMLLARYFASKAVQYLDSDLLHQEWPYRLGFVIILITITLIVVEPEKIKFAIYISSFLFYSALITLYGFIGHKISQNTAKVDLFYFDSSYLSSFIPLMIMCFETIATFFMLRGTLKKKKQMAQLLVIKSLIIIPIFMLNCSLFLFVN